MTKVEMWTKKLSKDDINDKWLHYYNTGKTMTISNKLWIKLVWGIRK